MTNQTHVVTRPAMGKETLFNVFIELVFRVKGGPPLHPLVQVDHLFFRKVLATLNIGNMIPYKIHN